MTSPGSFPIHSTAAPSAYYRKDGNQCKKAGEVMRKLGECILIMVLFMMATVAILQIDSQCRVMTGRGGTITASAEFIVEKVGPLQ